MRLLLDTHILIWLAGQPEKLPIRARALIEDTGNDVSFSVVSLWEIAIKNGLGREDFRIDPAAFHRALIDNGYGELALTGAHAVAVGVLPPLHKDPFDRMLVAQATVDGITLVTADPLVARYPGPILVV